MIKNFSDVDNLFSINTKEIQSIKAVCRDDGKVDLNVLFKFNPNWIKLATFDSIENARTICDIIKNDSNQYDK